MTDPRDLICRPKPGIDPFVLLPVLRERIARSEISNVVGQSSASRFGSVFVEVEKRDLLRVKRWLERQPEIDSVLHLVDPELDGDEGLAL